MFESVDRQTHAQTHRRLRLILRAHPVSLRLRLDKTCLKCVCVCVCVRVCVCFRVGSFHVLPIISIWQKIRLLGVACKDPNGALLQDFKNGLVAIATHNIKSSGPCSFRDEVFVFFS